MSVMDMKTATNKILLTTAIHKQTGIQSQADSDRLHLQLYKQNKPPLRIMSKPNGNHSQGALKPSERQPCSRHSQNKRTATMCEAAEAL